MQTYSPVRNAVALLVDTELWGFLTPSTLDLAAVRTATAKVQPYYATPSQYLALDVFPMTRNGKVERKDDGGRTTRGRGKAAAAGKSRSLFLIHHLLTTSDDCPASPAR